MKSFNKINTARFNRTIKTLALGAVVAMTCSCEDFLTIYPTNDVVLENYWKTKNDVENMANNSYRMMTTGDFTKRLIVWGELRGDNVVEGNNLGGDIKNIMEANLLPQNGYNDWSIFYKIINNCNIVLKYAPQVLDEDPDFTEGDLDVIRGEMLAIRALCHFYLVRAFRDIPLLDYAVIDDDQNLYQPQVSPREALDFILSDLYEAENLVMASGKYPVLSENKGRMTKDAVRAIIADALLWRAAFEQYAAQGGTADVAEYYTKCAEYCDMIINDRNAYVKEYEEENKITSIGWKDDKYPLEHHPLTNSGNTGVLDNPYSQIFGTPNNLRESIFEIQHSSSEDNANYEVPAFYGYYGSTDFTLGPLSAPRYMAEKSNEGLYAQTDFRRVSFIEHEDGEADLYNIIKFNYISASGTIDKPAYSSTYYKTTGTKDNNTYIMTQTNWIVYRITDVMLMKAEALAFRNDTTNGNTKDLENAFALTKAVYDRSNPYIKASTDTLTYTHGSAASLQEVILEERQRELAFEGKRWFDLVRKALRDGNTGPMLDILINNKYESNQKAIRSKMTAMDCLFFPILERELHANPLLKQNPAYETEDLFEKN
ncbi:MAG: RagB/SusD family nutrient uptake outer membrane protein [Bacteroidaceae bacterium]|nr:RagB/SusD family nutrient uptake outer membrane protein [Bacteroidaceae bacterium]